MSETMHAGGTARRGIDQLRAGIAVTRAQSGDTLAALAAKTDVKTRATRAARQTAARAHARGRQTVAAVNESLRRRRACWPRR